MYENSYNIGNDLIYPWGTGCQDTNFIILATPIIIMMVAIMTPLGHSWQDIIDIFDLSWMMIMLTTPCFSEHWGQQPLRLHGSAKPCASPPHAGPKRGGFIPLQSRLFQIIKIESSNKLTTCRISKRQIHHYYNRKIHRRVDSLALLSQTELYASQNPQNVFIQTPGTSYLGHKQSKSNQIHYKLDVNPQNGVLYLVPC